MPDFNSRPPAINLTRQEYKDITQKITPRPKVVKNAVSAFLVGGLICWASANFLNEICIAIDWA
jgi:stage V sporulation protein AC